MKVLYLLQDLGIPLEGHKGASAHVRGFVRALKALGHDILLATSSSDGNSELGVPVVSIPSPVTADGILPDKNPRLVRALRHLLNNVSVENVLKKTFAAYQPDMVYERYSPFGVVGGILSQRLGIYHVLEVNALLSQEGKRYRNQALQEVSELLEMTAFSTTPLIVTVSNILRESLISEGIPHSKIIYIPNGVEGEMFTPEGFSNREGLEGKIIIGFVGSLKPWHGIDLLAELFKKLATDPKYHLLVVGDGPMMKALKVLEMELPNQVTLTGAIPHTEVPKYMRAIDIALAPYPLLDDFYFSPLKVLEYMATGRAVIATRIGQINELICHGQTGLLVPSDDISVFLETIRKVAKDQDLRRTLGTNAAEEVRHKHTWTMRVTNILDVVNVNRAKSDGFHSKLFGEGHYGN